MAYEQEVLGFLERLVISDKHIIASLMRHRWKEGTSSVNNVYKALTNLAAVGKLVKGDGYFKLPGCKSEYQEHAQLLTKALAEILQTKLVSKIVREPTIPEIGLRPDALVLLSKEGKGLCFVLEVANHEKSDYLCQKINAWKQWDKATEYLSELFGTKIPLFDIVVSGGAMEGQNEFTNYLKEVANG